MKTMISSFDIHIFGDGSGETILLEFANSKFGIIDFGYQGFIPWFDKHIKGKENVVIEFLLWTHPHDDHTRYLSDLLNYLNKINLKISSFFIFPFRHIKRLSEFMDIGLNQKCGQDITDSPYVFTDKIKPKYLLSLYEQILDFKNRNLISEIERVHFLSELYKENILQNKLSIHCIAPTQDDIDRYEEIYNGVLQRRLQTEMLYPDSNNHNIISTAISIKFGNNNIILGGDVENRTWSNIMNKKRGKDYSCCDLSFLKVPHHGSETAYLKENWNNWGKDYHAAITTYNKSNLPKPQGIQNILNHTKKVYILKDVHRNLLLGEQCRLISESIKTQRDITTYAKATNHIKFTIDEDGKIATTWL